jgi:hypothetical protein
MLIDSAVAVCQLILRLRLEVACFVPLMELACRITHLWIGIESGTPL